MTNAQTSITLRGKSSPLSMEEYYELKESHGEFFAARFIVDIVDHYNHLKELKNTVNG